MEDAVKCNLIRLSGAAERLHMVIDHVLRRERLAAFDKSMIKTGLESLEHSISEYKENWQ